ncbi:MAG: ComEC/Rec2 family competence protein [Hyphomicrobiaceae bacterium]
MRTGPAAAVLRLIEAEQASWFNWVPVAFGAGVGLYFLLPFEPTRLVAAAGVIAAVVLRLVWRRSFVGWLTTAVVLAVALGFGAAKLRTLRVDAPILARPMTSAEVTGRILRAEPRPAHRARLTLAVEAIAGLPAERLPAERLPAIVRVSVPGDTKGLSPGQRVRLRATLAPPPEPTRPGGYDFARRAYFERLGAIGYARQRPEPLPQTGAPTLALRGWAAVQGVRQAVGERIRGALPGVPGAIAEALITGERGGLPEETTKAFRDSGLLHVLAISGLHMTIMAGTIFLVVRFALALVPGLAVAWPIKKWAAAVAALGALGYLLLSGASYSTQRAFVMMLVMLLAVLLERRALSLRNVGLAALLLLALFPESLLDISFQMSFAAVVALISVYETWRRMRPVGRGDGRRGPLRLAGLFLVGIIATTLIASLAVAPFGAYHFHKSQQYAVIANLIALPLVNFVIMPMALLTLLTIPLGLEAGPLWLMGRAIEVVVWSAHWVGGLPGAVALVPGMPVEALLVMIAGGLWLALWQRRWRLLGVLPVLLGVVLARSPDRADILVGRDGRAVAVREGGRLAALPIRGRAYELTRWLEFDGDPRPAAAAYALPAFRCDAVACTARVKGQLLSVVRHPAALGEDCQRAAIVLMTLHRALPCPAPRLVIDLRRLERLGAHAIYVRSDRLQVVTVAEWRGVRPWSQVEPRELRTSPRTPPASLPAPPPSGTPGVAGRTIEGIPAADRSSGEPPPARPGADDGPTDDRDHLGTR